jgi:hypothetical protein
VNDDDTSKRFSLVYPTSDKSLPDSKRARVRIKSLLNYTSITNENFAVAIQRELGVEVRAGPGNLDRTISGVSA